MRSTLFLLFIIYLSVNAQGQELKEQPFEHTITAGYGLDRNPNKRIMTLDYRFRFLNRWQIVGGYDYFRLSVDKFRTFRINLTETEHLRRSQDAVNNRHMLKLGFVYKILPVLQCRTSIVGGINEHQLYITNLVYDGGTDVWGNQPYSKALTIAYENDATDTRKRAYNEYHAATFLQAVIGLEVELMVLVPVSDRINFSFSYQPQVLAYGPAEAKTFYHRDNEYTQTLSSALMIKSFFIPRLHVNF